jgi:RNA polymerase sigma-70 factor (ECF subfamily)
MDTRKPLSVEDFAAHGRFVRDLARRLLAEDPHAAEDLAQDVWSAALQRPPPHRASLKGWLRAVTLALNSNRLRRRTLQREVALNGYARTDPPSAEQLDLHIQRRAVARAVHDLREPYRSVVLLRFYDGLPPREVARRLGRPVETVQTQTKRGLELLRQALKKDRASDFRSWLLLLAGSQGGRRFERMALPTACACGAAGLFVALQLSRPEPEEPIAPELGAPLASLAPEITEPPRPGSRESAPSSEPRGDTALQLLASSANEPARSERHLSVVIEDGAGRPVPDAALLVLREEGWTERGRADEQGRVEIDVAPEELGVRIAPDSFVWLRAQADGWATTHESLRDMDAPGRAHVRLALAPGGARLSGVVVDADSIAVPDARVLLLPSNLPTGTSADGVARRAARHETRTDEEGRFELAHLAQGASQVFLLHPDLGIGRCEIAVKADAQPAELRFEPGCIVSGTVTDEHGAPAAGCKVSGIDPELAALPSYWTQAVTDGAGSFVLPMSANPRLELWVHASGAAAEDALMASDVVDARAGADLEWNPRLRRWPPVRVRVVDKARNSVPDWFVSVMAERHGETRWNGDVTDERGEVALVLPVEGPLMVRVHGPLSGHRDTTVASLGGLSPSDEALHELEVDAQPQLGDLRVRVVTRGWTLPPDLLLSIEQEDRSSRVRVPLAADSSARAEQLAPGRYRVLALAPPSLMRELGAAEVEAGSLADLGDLELEPPGRLDVSQLPAETPLEVWLEVDEGKPRLAWRGAGGGADPIALLAGRYFLARGPSDTDELHFEMLPSGLVVIDADFKAR